MATTSPPSPFLSDTDAQARLEELRQYVAKPMPKHDGNNKPWTDPSPALVEGSAVLIGNKYHASNVPALVREQVTAVLNCASGGISRLPMDELQAANIDYEFTNVRRDDVTYPILYDWNTREPSQHLIVAKALYHRIKEMGGRVLFFCVAGQNRSAALAVAVLLLFGHKLEEILVSLSKTRPFVLENEGFQRQVIELEAMLQKATPRGPPEDPVFSFGNPNARLARRTTMDNSLLGVVEVELLIPGLCTMDVKIPKESSIKAVKARLVEYVNEFLLKHYSNQNNNNNTNASSVGSTSVLPASSSKVAKSWMVLAMFGYDDMYDFPCETEAIEERVQLELMQKVFGLDVFTPQGTNEQHVRWSSKCRFALVIFSVFQTNDSTNLTWEEPWTFVHEERPGAPATFLEYNLLTTHLRAWDFVTGQSYCSTKPIVFSFSPDPRDKRQFMRISTSANEPVQFHAPGEGGILGMGANAIVHRVDLGKVVASTNSREPGFMDACPPEDRWDAAVKRHFSYHKMVAFLENRSEAGLAKRIRLASSLNSDGRVVEFYGLGVGLAANCSNLNEYKFEAMLLARYEEEFSTYTMKKFMQDYLVPLERASSEERPDIEAMQSKFTLISVKVLLVSLLNAFRDLTLMGVQAFDFNNANVLVSRDYRLCRLIDIDGDSKGSIQLDENAAYIRGSPGSLAMHKPSLDIDLNVVLPTLVEQLILGKGRSNSFVVNKRSEIWRATPEKARELIMEILRENFYPYVHGEDERFKAEKHVHKVALWFYAMLKKQPPWGHWTRDIYDAMRCIDHLPIS
ncbi:expressed unknown protein [Seminavis robusta]|uniref:protein-tyrosine-phosphatase n=1 Tax=Seminavis robusta TaxID=568900 RepID=A0A9N8DRI6_9STRA|nr:expressed unknown protein [Seminavis robusta]|eukprot:Sro300_g111710.1 n/a (798) ;mRNA; r:26811-29204